MTNVLPISAQKKVWAVYRARFIITASLFILGLSALVGLALIPSYLALKLAAPVTREAAPLPKGEKEDASALPRAQALIVQLTPLITASTSPTAVISAALSARPAGVSLDHIVFDRGVEKKAGQVMLSGSATRDAVNAFRQTLAAQTYFKNISVPVGALVGSEGNRFSITATGPF